MLKAPLQICARLFLMAAPECGGRCPPCFAQRFGPGLNIRWLSSRPSVVAFQKFNGGVADDSSPVAGGIA